MRIISRAYSDSMQDFKKLWDFLIMDYREKTDRFVWSLGRLCDWKYGLWDRDKKANPFFFSDNARLWVNAFDEVVGFVLSEEGDQTFTVFAKDGYNHLYGEMLDFADAHWGSKGEGLCSEVHAHQHVLRELLEQRGFVPRPAGLRRLYNLSHCELGHEHKDGTKIVDMTKDPDFFAKRRLHKNGFRNTDEVSDWDLIAYAYNRESPVYNPKYDLSVVDDKGRHLSACLAFVDYENGYAEIERVCTHPDFRRQGLCVAVIRACFERLYQDKVKTAYITGYSEAALGAYGKLGAAAETKIFEYKKICGATM